MRGPGAGNEGVRCGVIKSNNRISCELDFLYYHHVLAILNNVGDRFLSLLKSFVDLSSK